MSVRKQWEEARAAHWAVRSLGDGFRDSLRSFSPEGGAAGLTVDCGEAPATGWEEGEGIQWFVVPDAAGSGAVASVACPQATAAAVSELVTGEKTSAADAEATVVELLNQAFGALAEQTAGVLGRRVEMGQAAAASKPETVEGGAVAFRFPLADQECWLAMTVNDQWLELLTPEPAANAVPATGVPAPTVSPASKTENLSRLMEVELDLAISFGETKLPLADVLKLSSGSIVELNRGVSEAVDLLINDSVVARGEVVVVDGNYGVRITEVSSPKARIESFL